MKIIKASIITIGDELLNGQTIDTNSTWMAMELNKIGVSVCRRVAVGDNWNDIWNALEQESNTAELIFITGGLGPTSDDITKPILLKYFGGKLVVNKKALENIKAIFSKLKRPLIERNLQQAEVPDTCTVLQNKFGTAPGMFFKKGRKYYFSLPGVPFEMKNIVTEQILPLLKKKIILPTILYRSILTAGRGESFVAELLMSFEKELPKNIKLAYLPFYSLLKLRLTAIGKNKKLLEQEFNICFEKLKKLVKEITISDQENRLEEIIGQRLIKKKKTIATVESCTGGYIAQLISSVPGASAYYKGSIVSYANETKKNLLHISSQTLEKNGAVSEAVVVKMLKSCIKKIKVDYAVATSGIMGPTSESNKLAVGTVWIAVGSTQKIITKKLELRFDRSGNIKVTSQISLALLAEFILKN